MTAKFGEDNLKAAILGDTGQGMTTHPLSPWFKSATKGNLQSTDSCMSQSTQDNPRSAELSFPCREYDVGETLTFAR